MAYGVVSEVICDDPKIIEHRQYDIGFNANRYRWDCGNKSWADIFYLDGRNEQEWVKDKRQFVKNKIKEQDNG